MVPSLKILRKKINSAFRTISTLICFSFATPQKKINRISMSNSSILRGVYQPNMVFKIVKIAYKPKLLSSHEVVFAVNNNMEFCLYRKQNMRNI